MRHLFIIILAVFQYSILSSSKPYPQRFSMKEKETVRCYDSLFINSSLLFIPCTIEKFNSEKEIDTHSLKLIFGNDYDSEYQYFYNYRVNDVNNSYFLISKHVEPGIMGIHNTLVIQVLFNNKKQLENVREVACFCNDYNSGNNQTITSVPVIHLVREKILVITTTTELIEDVGLENDKITKTIDSVLYENVSY